MDKVKKTLKGVVVSDKMDKTIVVSVTRVKEHPKYRKRFKLTKKYKAHDRENKYKIGDKVIIQESRPLSRGKKWTAMDFAQLRNTHKTEHGTNTESN